MTRNKGHSDDALRNSQGFSLLEVMTVVAVLGILATFAFPSARRMLDRQEAKASATQVAGLLTDARTRAVAEGTPHLVYFNAPEADADGNCNALAVEVRDADHSYSITDGDQQREFHLSDKACKKVKQYGEATEPGSEIAAVPLPAEDRAARAPDAAEVGAVGATVAAAAGSVGGVVGGVAGVVGGVVGGGSGSSGSGSSGSSGSGSSGSGSSGSGSGKSGSAAAAAAAAPGQAVAKVARSATIAETVVNGASFPVDATDGRPVIAFTEQGIAVDPANPTQWGSGAGAVYLTDGESTVVAAVVAPLGDVQLRVFETGSGTWR